MSAPTSTLPAAPARSARSMRRWRLVVLVSAIPLAGELLGHPLFASIGDAFAHHAFHAATVMAAAVLFWRLVAEDIRRHGVPPRLRAVQRGCRSLRAAAA
ncbi:MAG: hypothetical protein ACRDMZ_15820, partial [Solirubrobacteraceae bacterium]